MMTDFLLGHSFAIHAVLLIGVIFASGIGTWGILNDQPKPDLAWEGFSYKKSVADLAHKAVIVGVLLEAVFNLLLFGADELISQSQEEKIIELEVKLSHRSLSSDAQTRISEKLRPFGNIPFDFMMLVSEPETLGLMDAILDSLKSAGWEPKDWHNSGSVVINLPGKPQLGVGASITLSGVLVQIDDTKTSEWGGAAAALISALNAEGIKTEGKRITDKTENPAAIHIYIGKKP